MIHFFSIRIIGRQLFIGLSSLLVYTSFIAGRKVFKYPKLTLFIATVLIVYFLFSGVLYEPLYNVLVYLGYFGTFLAGILYPYSFTSVAATAILLIIAKTQNVLYAGLVASFGALLSDLAIFFFVKRSFGDEVLRLSKEPAIQRFSRRIRPSIRAPLIVAFASILIASPLPTEIGIMLMTSVKKISTKKFAVIVYALHVSAIYVILFIGSRI
jgi:hypothetical protein